MKIMIVEDDSVSRKVMVKKLSPVGDCIEADSGKDAISRFSKATKSKKPFDLILLDISMPDMDGIQVLSTLRKKESQLNIPKAKQVKIIMMTASMRKASIQQCIRLGCNSYLSKPLNIAKLFQEFDRFGFIIPEDLKSADKNQNAYTDHVTQIIKRFNNKEIELPVLPHMVKEIQQLLESSEPSIEELAGIIQKDAVISGKLILVANSALYKGVETISTLNAALIRLGIKETLDIITTITSKNLFDSDNKPLKLLLNQIWMHSLACACCGKFLAEELSGKPLEGVFLMGIIHDIGKVLLLKAIADISPDEPIKDKALLSAIQEVHTVFGAVLIKKWGFSKEQVRAVELHHWESYPDWTEQELLITHIADIMVSKIGLGSFGDFSGDQPDEEFSPAFYSVLKQLDIEPDRIEPISDRVKEMMKKIANSF
ncbi:MAG: HDOD domain-containing protein [Pseudomonadota bacterium]